jgi:hypothetical protein
MEVHAGTCPVVIALRDNEKIVPAALRLSLGGLDRSRVFRRRRCPKTPRPAEHGALVLRSTREPAGETSGPADVSRVHGMVFRRNGARITTSWGRS